MATKAVISRYPQKANETAKSMYFAALARIPAFDLKTMRLLIV